MNAWNHKHVAVVISSTPVASLWRQQTIHHPNRVPSYRVYTCNLSLPNNSSILSTLLHDHNHGHLTPPISQESRHGMEPIYAQGTPLAAYLEGPSAIPLSLKENTHKHYADSAVQARAHMTRITTANRTTAPRSAHSTSTNPCLSRLPIYFLRRARAYDGRSSLPYTQARRGTQEHLWHISTMLGQPP